MHDPVDTTGIQTTWKGNDNSENIYGSGYWVEGVVVLPSSADTTRPYKIKTNKTQIVHN